MSKIRRRRTPVDDRVSPTAQAKNAEDLSSPQDKRQHQRQFLGSTRPECNAARTRLKTLKRASRDPKRHAMRGEDRLLLGESGLIGNFLEIGNKRQQAQCDSAATTKTGENGAKAAGLCGSLPDFKEQPLHEMAGTGYLTGSLPTGRIFRRRQFWIGRVLFLKTTEKAITGYEESKPKIYSSNKDYLRALSRASLSKPGRQGQRKLLLLTQVIRTINTSQARVRAQTGNQ